MGKMESIIKSEIVRLAKRETRKVSVPLKRDVQLLKKMVLEIRRTVQGLEQWKVAQQKQLAKREIQLEALPQEVKISRFSPRLIRSLRQRLGISQKELAVLTGVTIGAVHMWETGKFKPKDEKRKSLVALRKLRRREVRKLLEQKETK